MTVRPPGDKFGNGERVDVIHELFNDKIIRYAKIRGTESPVWERKIDTVHAEGDLILQLAEIGLLQAGTIPHYKGAFPLVNILHLPRRRMLSRRQGWK